MIGMHVHHGCQFYTPNDFGLSDAPVVSVGFL